MVNAALSAAAGAGLLVVFYVVVYVVPLARNPGEITLSAVVPLALLLILPQSVWTWFFTNWWRGQLRQGAALTTLLLAVAPQTLYSWTRQWATFSLYSIDSIFYLFSGVFLPVAYAWFLIASFRGPAIRRAAYLLWVLTTFQAMATIFNLVTELVSIRGSLPMFWDQSPLATFWSLFASPAILIFHWGSQSYFFTMVRKRP